MLNCVGLHFMQSVIKYNLFYTSFVGKRTQIGYWTTGYWSCSCFCFDDVRIYSVAHYLFLVYFLLCFIGQPCAVNCTWWAIAIMILLWCLWCWCIVDEMKHIPLCRKHCKSWLIMIHDSPKLVLHFNSSGDFNLLEERCDLQFAQKSH